MSLTPLDIKKKEFGRSLRGFDPAEVSSFLASVSEEMDRLSSGQRDTTQRIADLERQLGQYSNLERNIQQALVQAQESAAKTLETVQREVAVKLRESELEASRIVDTARRDAEKILNQATTDVAKFSEEISTLRSMRSTLVARIKTFLTQEAHLLRELEHDNQTSIQPALPSNPFAVPIDEILKSLE